MLSIKYSCTVSMISVSDKLLLESQCFCFYKIKVVSPNHVKYIYKAYVVIFSFSFVHCVVCSSSIYESDYLPLVSSNSSYILNVDCLAIKITYLLGWCEFQLRAYKIIVLIRHVIFYNKTKWTFTSMQRAVFFLFKQQIVNERGNGF
jgi:hypothetical protein